MKRVEVGGYSNEQVEVGGYSNEQVEVGGAVMNMVEGGEGRLRDGWVHRMK